MSERTYGIKHATKEAKQKEARGVFVKKAREFVSERGFEILREIAEDAEVFAMGRIKAIEVLAGYAYGKPTQRVEVETLEKEQLSSLSNEELLAVARAQLEAESRSKLVSGETVEGEIVLSQQTQSERQVEILAELIPD